MSGLSIRLGLAVCFIGLLLQGPGPAAGDAGAAVQGGAFVEINKSKAADVRVIERSNLYGSNDTPVIGLNEYGEGRSRLSRAIKDVAGDYKDFSARFPKRMVLGLAERRLSSLREQWQIALTPAEAPPAAFEIEEMNSSYRATTRANVRAGPATSYDRVATLSEGQGVTVTGKVRGANWFRISFGGNKEGFIFGKLIQDMASYQAAKAEALRQAEAAVQRRATAAVQKQVAASSTQQAASNRSQTQEKSTQQDLPKPSAGKKRTDTQVAVRGFPIALRLDWPWLAPENGTFSDGWTDDYSIQFFVGSWVMHASHRLEILVYRLAPMHYWKHEPEVTESGLKSWRVFQDTGIKNFRNFRCSRGRCASFDAGAFKCAGFMFVEGSLGTSNDGGGDEGGDIVSGYYCAKSRDESAVEKVQQILDAIVVLKR